MPWQQGGATDLVIEIASWPQGGATNLQIFEFVIKDFYDAASILLASENKDKPFIKYA